MKKLLSLTFFALIGALMVISSCSDDDNGGNTPDEPGEQELKGIIAEDMTFTNDKIWILSGRVIVPEGVTLTIEPGTIIKGAEGDGSLASALIISRGAKINAVGTAANPIIFTSVIDDIKVGEKKGTLLTRKDNKKWGGLIILGKAHISAEKGDTEASIEGLPPDEEYGKYGGDDNADNSGILKYVSIRHGGALIGEGNEINGLTLGGVGSGTTIDHIEVFATFDDGVEFFGGTVKVTNFLSYWQGDDGVDIDQNFAGTVDNFMVIHGDGDGSDDVATDSGMEIDGPENSTYTDGLFTAKNGTLMGVGTVKKAINLKSKAQGTIENVYVSGYTAGNYVWIRTSHEDFCGATKTDAFTHFTDETPSLVVKDSEFDMANTDGNLVKVYTESVTAKDSKTTCDIDPADKTAAEDVFSASGNSYEVTSPTVGADASEFDGWTLASTLDLL